MPQTSKNAGTTTKRAVKTKTKAATKTAARKTPARKAAITTRKLAWRDITCRVRHTPDYLLKGWSHIEIIVISPRGAPPSPTPAIAHTSSTRTCWRRPEDP